MYYSEVISLLKSGPSTLKARRTCWDNAHIIYDHDMSKLSYVRQQEFEDGTVVSSCYCFIASQGDLTRDDWEIFE